MWLDYMCESRLRRRRQVLTAAPLPLGTIFSHDLLSCTSSPDDGIVVLGGRKGRAAMEIERVAPALQERLGLEATVGLLALLETTKQEWTAEVTTAAVDRFERRLTTETANLRIAMAEQGAQLRQEMAEQGAQLRREMTEQGAQLRQEMAEQFGKLRHEMAEQNGRLRVDMAELGARLAKDSADGRFALLKWSFAFWIGQVVAMAAVMAVMLRLTGH